VLRQTFLHVPGIGPRREEALWHAGVRSWDDFALARVKGRLPPAVAGRVAEELVRSEEALARGRYRYFATRLQPREHWRAWPDFRREAAFLDIETTGLSIGRDAVTVVGVYDGNRKRSFVKGINMEELPRAFDGRKMLVTFNGLRFDVPFLKRAFPGMALGQIHVDLMHPLHRLGFYGGLKAIERRLGIKRSEATEGLSGFDAVRLWHAYEEGDDDALETLVAYNLEDVVNLEPLADFAYRELRALCLEGGFVTADRYGTLREPAP
jgi:uncharacterized protein YprB with RNaseH-like and TPR domain